MRFFDTDINTEGIINFKAIERELFINDLPTEENVISSLKVILNDYINYQNSKSLQERKNFLIIKNLEGVGSLKIHLGFLKI